MTSHLRTVLRSSSPCDLCATLCKRLEKYGLIRCHTPCLVVEETTLHCRAQQHESYNAVSKVSFCVSQLTESSLVSSPQEDSCTDSDIAIFHGVILSLHEKTLRAEKCVAKKKGMVGRMIHAGQHCFCFLSL